MNTRIVGYQRWSHLAFLHWRIEPDVLQKLLPVGLKVDTFDGSGWLAFVPFSMERVRPWWGMPVPGISWFLETNVRTYVRHENGQSGVWFFSLDANQRLAVFIARRFWHLNYVNADLELHYEGGEFRCRGRRRLPPHSDYDLKMKVETNVELQTADEGTLEHFLLERYHLFAQRPDGRFLCGQVHHEPYQFRPISDVSGHQTLTAAADCPFSDQPEHILYSPGVDVSVSPLHLVE